MTSSSSSAAVRVIRSSAAFINSNSLILNLFRIYSCSSPCGGMASKFVDDQLANHSVVVFSKSYCPYCKMAKQAIAETGAKFQVIEIEDRDDCDAIQNYLQQKTGARSVPRVFIGGKCIGGGTETRTMKDQGKLVPALKEAGAL